MAEAAKFWDRHAEGYAKRPVADEESYQKKLAVTQEYFRPDMEVMEFGCGTGSTAIVHAPYVKHIRATDISPEMIAIAKRKAAAANVENITFEAVTIEDIDVADASLDAVMAHSILHLLEDKEAAIANVYRMLKPGGILVTSTPCLSGGYKWLKPVLPIGRVLGLLPLVRFFSKEELETSITDAGLEIDYTWQPAKGPAVFIVAKKPG